MSVGIAVPTQISPALANVDAKLLRELAKPAADPDFWSPKARDRSDSAHCIFLYPAMMVPVVQRRLLDAVLTTQSGVKSIYDPFVGSGTSLVSGMHYGLATYGNDINPLAVLISRVRTSREFDGSIRAICEKVVSNAEVDGSSIIETELKNWQKWFKTDVAIELSRLRRAIRNESDLWVRRFLWVTLAETIRLTSNDRTSTYKLHARSAEDIERRNLSPIKVFMELSLKNSTSFHKFRRELHNKNKIDNGAYCANTKIILADARDDLVNMWEGHAPFDLLMTSPPYGDNITTVTYGQHSYLPLNWIDFTDIDPAADINSLRTTQEIDRRGLGGRTIVTASDEEALFSLSPTLKKFADTMSAHPKDGRVRLMRFYRDFSKSLEMLTRQLRPNGYMIWTVGNRNIGGQQVPTDGILGELLEGQRCRLVTTLRRTIHHKRMPDRNASSKTMREEKIVLARKLAD
ncbi:hypothetical protein [Azospirillum griseum]|uniref:site-specific DNA-methyltransferase (cytosine-N(4)-specific) n=1 Tax=Azospirillum griseum TaxID=2496639 RepID=A0A431V9X0_9PROT|nr:hypothetical protein [Azospirillum griseum]RTR12485.1 hypothetical protein EJ903_25345 [Azospirillum griseum]